MANCRDMGALWEWDSWLALSDVSPSFFESDNSASHWQRDPFEYASPQGTIVGLAKTNDANCSVGQPETSGGSLDSGRNSGKEGKPGSHNDSEIGTWHLRTSVQNVENHASRDSPRDSALRQNKRNPRLSCPNFLAGRIPCSCPELEDNADIEPDAEEVARKRVRPSARCQVPSCGADISHLKGYHQRHRVCLGCANSSQLILNDQAHRYCQQCGKFHLLSDFDEGKRSCRWKLERHNNRRRRKASEVGEATGKDSFTLSSDREPHGICSHSDATGNNGDDKSGSPFVSEQSIVAGEHRLEKQSMDSELSCQASGISSEQLPVCFEGTEAGTASPIEVVHSSVICGPAGFSAGVEGAKSDAVRLQLCQQLLEFSPGRLKIEKYSIPSSSGESHHFSSGGSVKKVLQIAVPEEPQAIEASSVIPAKVRHDNLGTDLNGSRIGEQSFNLLMNDNVEGNFQPCNSRLLRQTQEVEPEVPRSSVTSSAHKKHSLYMSPCSTSRVSFKLYDWNPADFPRRLRQQIFEWLSNMPVELEGYIRSGCIILTFFLTMPRLTWRKLNDEWVLYAQNLFCGPQHQFWGGGCIIARLNNKILKIQNGEVQSENFKEEFAPILHNVYPLCLEAGCTSEVYVFGKNLFRTTSRFLVSFRGLYLECHASRWECSSEELEGIGLDDFETCKITICTPEPRKYGTAYVEVDHDLGVSNFMPMLVADGEICAEVNSLRQNLELKVAYCDSELQNIDTETCLLASLEQQVSDLLIDLGWVLRHVQDDNSVKGIEVCDTFLERLQRLLLTSRTMGWHAVTKQLLQIAETTGVFAKLGGLGIDCNALEMSILSKHQDIDKILIDLQRVVGKEHGILNNDSWNGNAETLNCISVSIKASEVGQECVYKMPQNMQSLLDGQYMSGEKIPSIVNEIIEPRTWSFGQLKVEENSLDKPLLEGGIPSNMEGLRICKIMAHPLQCFKKSMKSVTSVGLYACHEKVTICHIVLIVFSIVTVCTGMCLMLQHPLEVAKMSNSLSHCLRGSVGATTHE
eukprot:c28247_g2_i2 orf=387-3470(+)